MISTRGFSSRGQWMHRRRAWLLSIPVFLVGCGGLGASGEDTLEALPTLVAEPDQLGVPWLVRHEMR